MLGARSLTIDKIEKIKIKITISAVITKSGYFAVPAGSNDMVTIYNKYIL